jgi:hypothetical protein
MPLLDHFQPPHRWESFHSNWATRLADALNERLPPEFIAEEHTHAGPTATAPAVWPPPAPARTMPAVFPDTFEVRVFSTTTGLTLVGVIELVSPGNKDRADERRAFATRCASYLYQRISLIVIDIVTSRHANLHNDTMRLMEADASLHLPAEVSLYAVAYRPVVRQQRPEIDLWLANCALGAPLPVLPLALPDDRFVPVDFEAAYQEACRRRRLA